MISLASTAVVAALSMAALIAGSATRVAAQNGLGTDLIIGSWHVTVSFDDGRPNVLALYTFDRDRNFTMDGSWPAYLVQAMAPGRETLAIVPLAFASHFFVCSTRLPEPTRRLEP